MENHSIWQICTDMPPEAPREAPRDCHVAIIGGGICGLLCAYRLAQAGVRDIRVIEAGRVGRGTTSRTTAKITAQHGIQYSKMMKSLGPVPTRQYAAANLEAVEQFERIIKRHGIDCAFRRNDAWLYARTEKDAWDLRQEAKAADTLGIRSELARECPLPFRVRAALRFYDQADFSPLAFVYALREIVLSMGVAVHEHTRALTVKKNRIYTERCIFSAERIILATHYPMLDAPGLYFLRLYQSRSYVLALQNAQPPVGMYLDAAASGLSFREAFCGGESLLLLGGADHRTGTDGDGRHYRQLKAEAGRLYPEARVAAQWSAQDCMTYDGIPYIGRLSAAVPDVYVATGFNKWGMSSSMAAAVILSDLITRGKSRYQNVFSPQRFDPALSAPAFFKNIPKSVGGIAAGLLARPGADGVLPRCTHMGGALQWNADEGTWDCKSHGSRFRLCGEVEEEPASKRLPRCVPARKKRGGPYARG